MLELGGNAADAAAAAALALAVVEPTMSGLGGRVQILLRRPGGQIAAIDGTTQVPSSYRDDAAPRGSTGYAAVAVPGQVAGVLKLQEDHGRLSRAEVLEPAISHARDGFALLPAAANRFAAIREDLLRSDGARRAFLKPDGTTYRAGEILVQADLANTLSTLSDLGVGAFYTGPIAEQIVTDLENNDGYVTLEDLERYDAQEARVVTGSYRELRLVGSDRPAGGGTTIEALQILESFDLSSLEEEAWASVVGQALLLAFEDRYSPVPPEEENTALITSKAWASRRARSIRVPTGAAVSEAPRPTDLGGEPAWLAHEHTSHLSVADRDGMVVALTQSLGPSGGARVATPGLGFLYATTLGGYLGPVQPGQRPSSAMTPFLVLDGDEVKYVLGAAGGVRIISSIVEVMSRVVDRGYVLPDAVAAPRFFPGFRVRADPVPWEFERQDATSWDENALAGMGMERRFVERGGAFGRMHAIGYDAQEGVWLGVADPGWEGVAAVPRGPTDVRIRTAGLAERRWGLVH